MKLNLAFYATILTDLTAALLASPRCFGALAAPEVNGANAGPAAFVPARTNRRANKGTVCFVVVTAIMEWWAGRSALESNYGRVLLMTGKLRSSANLVLAFATAAALALAGSNSAIAQSPLFPNTKP